MTNPAMASLYFAGKFSTVFAKPNDATKTKKRLVRMEANANTKAMSIAKKIPTGTARTNIGRTLVSLIHWMNVIHLTFQKILKIINLIRIFLIHQMNLIHLLLLKMLKMLKRIMMYLQIQLMYMK